LIVKRILNRERAMRHDTRWGAWLALAAIAASSAGCGEGESGASDLEESRAWGDSVVLVEEMRIGELDGDEHNTFGSVLALAPAPDGSLYVADRQVPIIRRYDADGRYMGDIGRGGDGPGEYRTPAGLAVAGDGRLFVWDPPLGRLSMYDSAGDFLDSNTLAGGVGGQRVFVWGTEGQMLLRKRDPESREPAVRWVEVTEDGALNALHDVPPSDLQGPSYTVAGRGGPYRPLVTETLSTVGPDGSLYVARNDEYLIYRILPGGDTLRIRRDKPRIRATSEELAEWEAFSEYFAERVPAQRDEFFPIPTVKPFMRELVVDPEGRLWVSRYTEPVFMEYSPYERESREESGLPSYQWRDTITWDVFSPEGDLLGVVTFPIRTSFFVALGDRVWGVRAGEYQEDLVTRWRIEEVAPGTAASDGDP